ncbi:MAG: tetratricopeptide repeat protein [Candidatus Omnitrophota bacterium]|jgi:tetratricopeptide (TPR) repeat protein
MRIKFFGLSIRVLFLLAVWGYPFAGHAEKVSSKDSQALEGEILSISQEYIGIKQILNKKDDGASQQRGTIFSDDSSGVSYDYKTALKDIEKHIRQKNYQKAGELCDSLLRYYGDNRQVHYLRALLNQRIGELEKAINDYQFLIEHQLADAKVYNNLASIYAQKEDFAKAKDLYIRAIQENYGMAEAHNNLADLYMRDDEFNLAMGEYEKVVALEPNNTGALYNLGVIYAKNRDYAQAQEKWKKVLSLRPEDTLVHNALDSLEKLVKTKQKEE